MYWLSTQSIFIIVLSLSIMACGNDSNEPETVLNVDPVAMVAENQIVAPLMLVTLSGINSSDIDGSIAHYQWTQTAGVSVTLSDDTTDTATFTAPDNGTDESLAFTLTVTDNNGASHSADTTVLVKVSTKISRSAWDNSFSKLESQNFVIWWGEQQGDLSEAANALLIKAEQTWQVAVQDFGMIPPPGAEQYLTNIYLYNSWGDELLSGGPGVGTDDQGYAYFAYPYNMAQEIEQAPDAKSYAISTVFHEIFHLFQYTPTNTLNIFPYQGDNAWYIESTANWFGYFMLPGVHDDFDPIAAYVLNPQLPLWAGDNNQTFNYPQYDPGNWSRAVHQYGSYVFFIYLQEFVMDKEAVATMISQSWSEQTNLYPQQVLFNKLASLGFSMASIFADFAAHNVTWDYKNDVDAYKYWEQRWTVDMDSYNEANKTIASHTTSTDGWQAPPNELLPSAWAYNVVELNSENNASVLIEFNADEHGNAGTSSQFEVRVIIESGDSSEQRTYSSLNIEDGQASQSFLLNQGQTLWLVVASVPNLFSGNETFNYQYKMTLEQ